MKYVLTALILLITTTAQGRPENGPDEGWQAFVAPGPVVSNHTPPVYTVDEDGLIVRATDKEDQARLGMGAFVILYNADKLESFGVGAGIGVDSDMQTRVYMGGSYRFGTRAAVMGGVAVGPVPRLPDHINEGDPYEGDLVGLEMSSRIEFGWYVTFVYVAWDSLGR